MWRRIDERILVAGQLRPADMAVAREAGVTMIVNNRPDDEEPGQPAGAEIEAAARAAGLDYRFVPVGHGGFSANQVAAMAEAMASAEGPLLAFCRSGTRSTYLWALASARDGADGSELAAKAAAAGYDLAPISAFLR